MSTRQISVAVNSDVFRKLEELQQLMGPADGAQGLSKSLVVRSLIVQEHRRLVKKAAGWDKPIEGLNVKKETTG